MGTKPRIIHKEIIEKMGTVSNGLIDVKKPLCKCGTTSKPKLTSIDEEVQCKTCLKMIELIKIKNGPKYPSLKYEADESGNIMYVDLWCDKADWEKIKKTFKW